MAAKNLIRIYKEWDFFDPLRQTPGGRGEWRGNRFVVGGCGKADYVVIHSRALWPAPVWCSPDNVWLLMGEPPNEEYKVCHRGAPWMARVYTSDEDLLNPKNGGAGTPEYRRAGNGWPWMVNKSFDFLTTCGVPEKSVALTWIMSAYEYTEGHLQRIETMNALKDLPEIELWGRHIRPIADKWDALAPARYAIAHENFRNNSYWTEKIADCFLAWTMPIYYGARDIAQFFPPESFVRLDPTWPDLRERVRAIVHSDLRERNLDAIAEARRRVLYDHNLFEYLTREIEADQASAVAKRPARPLLIRDHTRTPAQTLSREFLGRIGPTRVRVGALRHDLGRRLRGQKSL